MKLARVVLVLGHLLIPVYLICRFAANSFASLLELLLSAAALLSFCGLMYCIGRWDWHGFWLRYLLLLVPLALIVVKLTETQRDWLPNELHWLALIIDVFMLLVFCGLISKALTGAACPDGPSCDVAFPFANGVYYIAHGGNNSLINQHAPDKTQKYAVDIVKLGPLGMRAWGWFPVRLDRFSTWKESVLSPVQGTVISVVDGLPDNPPSQPDEAYQAGNCIVLRPDHEPNMYILLSHLRQSSVKVRPGDVVRQGRCLAEVGNSGESFEPHLHVHCAILPNKDMRAQPGEAILGGIGIPMLFEGRFLVRNNLVNVKRAETIEVDQFATSTA